MITRASWQCDLLMPAMAKAFTVSIWIPLSREPSSTHPVSADRNILVDQGYNAFSAFPEDALVRKAPDDTRKKLLEGLSENGFGKAQLAEIQNIIDAENSDLFDVLAFVAYALMPISREQRAGQTKIRIGQHFNYKQQAFLDFVLSHYVSVGVEELEQVKLTPLLRLKYQNSIADAVADLGRPEEIGKIFSGFQQYLYQ